jgi:hypothetical protein
MHAGAFPLANLGTPIGVVNLTEESPVLELLFQFIYPMRHPNLSSIPFETLTDLAYTAEKYKVYSAMSICNVYMQ